jgi:DNA-binding NarL/FixJ family response regulator
MTTKEQIRILFADDHPMVREGMVSLLRTYPDLDVVAEAVNGQEAVKKFRVTQPDITLMDLRLPVMSGLEAIKAIRNESPEARIIVLSSYDGDEDIYRAMQAGARGYILKDMVIDELVDAIRTVNQGRRHIPPAVAERLAKRTLQSELTARELDVLKLIVKGLSNKEIATSLFVTEETVKTHVKNILSKLEVADRTQAVIVAHQRGITPIE